MPPKSWYKCTLARLLDAAYILYLLPDTKTDTALTSNPSGIISIFYNV